MDLNATDRVIFYFSETEVGRCAALVLTRLLQDRYKGIEVRAREIAGLQVTDAARFRKLGLINFLTTMSSDIESYGAPQCILNPIGGFKALVPYSVLLGMMKSVRTAYLFEGSKQLIELPPLPIDFAGSLVGAYSTLFEALNRETSLNREALQGLLSGKAWNDAKLLLEEEDGNYTLSAVGHLLWQALGDKRPLIPYVSVRAISDLETLAAREGCDPYGFLEMVSRNREQLEAKKHGNVGGGLSWLKPGRTPDRYLISVERSRRLLVWQAADHAEYDRSPKDLGTRLRLKERDYSPFLRLDRFSFD